MFCYFSLVKLIADIAVREMSIESPDSLESPDSSDSNDSCFFQTKNSLCNPAGTDWYHNHAKDQFSCITGCQGVYADVNYSNESMTETSRNLFEYIARKYTDLKVESLQFTRKLDEKNMDLIYGRLFISLYRYHFNHSS